MPSKNIKFDRYRLRKLRRRHRLKFIILHGSHVTGKARRDSDVDIAVVRERATARSKSFLDLHHDLTRALSRANGLKLDLKPLDRTDPLFRHEVVRDGRLICGDKTAYEEFKAVTLRMYEDARPLFELEHALTKKYQRALNRTRHDQQTIHRS